MTKKKLWALAFPGVLLLTSPVKAQTHDHEHHHEMERSEPTEHSIFNLEKEWTTQDEDTITLGELRGSVIVMAMVYTNCQYVCPRIVADMRRIETAVSERSGDQVTFVVVSIDPTRDTPARLREFAKEQGLDTSHWMLLRGEANSVLELAMLLGVKFKRVGETEFAHSNIISVLDTEGEIRHQQLGLGTKPDEAVAAIEAVLVPDDSKSITNE